MARQRKRVRKASRGKRNDVTKVALGFSDIYPEESWSLELLRSEIRRTGHYTTLYILSQINGLIAGDGDLPHPERQVAALHRLVPRKSPLAYRIVERTLPYAEGGGPRIFTRSQLLELLRWTVLDAPEVSEAYDDKLPIPPERCEAFLRAALLASEVWHGYAYRTGLGEGLSLEEKRWKSLREFRLGSEAGRSVGDWRVELGRGLDWYRDRLPDPERGKDTDFPDRFRQVTGMGIEDYLACVGGLVTCSSGDMKFGIDPDHPWVHPDKRELLRQFLDFEAITLADMRTLLLKDLKGSIPETVEQVPALGLRPFREHPLLRLPSGATMIPDPVFLLDRASVSPFFIGLQRWKGKKDQAFGHFGDAVEGHVSDILERICGKDDGEAAPKLDTSIHLKKQEGTEVEVDGLMVQRKVAVVLEAKGSFGNEAALLSEEPEGYLASLDQKLVENSDRLVGVGQLARTAKLIGEERLAPEDQARFKKVRRILPVLVVLDPGMASILHGRYFGRRFQELMEDRTLEDSEAPAGPLRVGRVKVELPIVLSIEDLEMLEPVMDGGRLIAFFSAFLKSCGDGIKPVRNFFAENRETWAYGVRRYAGFREAALEVSDRTLELFDHEALEAAKKAGPENIRGGT